MDKGTDKEKVRRQAPAARKKKVVGRKARCDAKARPITGEDMLRLKSDLFLGTHEFQMLMGSATRKFSTIDRSRLEPIKNRQQAMIARILLDDKNVSPIPVPPDPDALRRKMEKIAGIKIPESAYGLYFGVCGSSGYQWIRRRTKPAAYIRNLMLILDMMLDKYGLAGWEAYRRHLDQEAVVAGFESFEEVLKHRSWKKKDIKDQEKRAQRKAAAKREEREAAAV